MVHVPSIEDIERAVLHHHPAPGVTVTAAITTSTAERKEPLVTTFAQAIGSGFAEFAADVAKVAPKVEAIATNPKIDELVDAALAAAGLGIPAEVFDFLTAALRSHVANAQGSGAQAADSGQPPVAPAETAQVPQAAPAGP